MAGGQGAAAGAALDHPTVVRAPQQVAKEHLALTLLDAENHPGFGGLPTDVHLLHLHLHFVQGQAGLF